MFFEGIKPVSWNPRTWKIYKLKKPVKYALELPEGSVKNVKNPQVLIRDLLKIPEVEKRIFTLNLKIV